MRNYIATRDDLLGFILAKSPIIATCRGIKEDGIVENLGGFHQVPGSALPGWIVKVTTKFKQVFLTAVVVDESTRSYRTYDCTTHDIPWDRKVTGENLHPLYAGDNPEEYKKFIEGTEEWKLHQKKS